MKKSKVILLAIGILVAGLQSCKKENSWLYISNSIEASVDERHYYEYDDDYYDEYGDKHDYGYDLVDYLWRAESELYVTDGVHSDTFSMMSEPGRIYAMFRQNHAIKIDGEELEVFFPSSLIRAGSPCWPKYQYDGMSPLTYCKKNASETPGQFYLHQLGSVLDLSVLDLSGKQKLKQIEITSPEKTLSGYFEVAEDGYNIEITSEDGAGIIYDLGDGESLGPSGNIYRIYLPAGNYNTLNFKFVTTDGLVCKRKLENLELLPNSMHSLKLPELGFRPVDEPLPGVFSVSESTKVRFSSGNLTHNSYEFHFEENQYDSPDPVNPNHLSLFFFSQNEKRAYRLGYSYEDLPSGCCLFTNETPETANPYFTVNNATGVYRALSHKEWEYLLNKRPDAEKLYVPNVNVMGARQSLILYPDDYQGVKVDNSNKDTYYKVKENWLAAQEAGAVCLPAAGYRYDYYAYDRGSEGVYWYSDKDSVNSHLSFSYGAVFTDGQSQPNIGHSIRLVTDLK